MSLEATASEAIENNLEQFLIVLSVSLSVAAISRSPLFPWFRRFPYTLLLVIVGLGFAFINVRLVSLSPQLILEIFLPPLLFEAAWNFSWREFKEYSLPIVLYATIGVVVSTLLVGVALNQLTAFSLPVALLIGAGLSATDPVAVVALFKDLGANPRLKAVTEGESLLNDGVAIVAFVLLLDICLGTEAFTLSGTVARFLTFVSVGLAIGLVVGFGVSYLTQRFDLPLVEQSLTLVSAYGSYLVAEHLGGSGVIAVVVVGMILGNFGSQVGMSPRTRLVVTEFWEFLAFFLNSIIFLLIGTQIRYDSLASHLGLIGIAIAAATIGRLISVFGLGLVSNAFSKSKITLPEQTALWWGGLRGAIPIALVLSIPETLPGRDVLINIVFGFVLFTLLVQGLSMQTLMKTLNLVGDQPLRQEYTQMLARRIALQRVKQSMVDSVDEFPDLDPEFRSYQSKLVEVELQGLEEKIKTMRQEYPKLRTLAEEQYKRTMLDVEADTYAELLRSGWLNRSLTPILEEIEIKLQSEKAV
ncbi:sodium:proton antiporter [Chroococcus sp. FPU101]|uniref:cation:proton antiporter n=1 Tax=Chroococcus sp. FPU101 TaxID=1974212 RepID=UPI001A8C755D|nr:sodium:proton antiporter [Chroococcus sp. FPU101]GFE68162.1 Na+/H+ antiporter [Chroococcus sp. FPU101]